MKTIHKLGVFPLILCLVLTSIPVAWAIELVRQKNVATYVMFPIVNQTGAPITSASGLDSEIDAFSDGSAPDGFADAAGEATEIGSTGIYRLALNATEMNNDYIYVQIKSSSTGAITQHVLIRTIVGDPLNIATTDDGGTINVSTGAIDTVAAVTTVNGIANDAITAAAIATDAIGAAEIAADAIGASEIAADAIGASEIAANAITTAELATGCISSDEVADNAIDAGAIATDAITAAKIAADAIGASEIATDAIGAAEIAASAITSSEAPALQYLTGDAYVRLGAPAGASVSADIAAVKSDTAAVLVDTAAMDSSTELRTLLTGSDTAVSTLTASDNIGINWADVANPTTTVNLSGTSIAGIGTTGRDAIATTVWAAPWLTVSAVSSSVAEAILGIDTNVSSILTDTAAMDTSSELRTLLCGSNTAISTYAGGDTSGTTTLLSRLSAARAGYLDYLDAAVSSRMATFSLPTNFSYLAISDAGKMTVGTNDDKSGYRLSTTGIDDIWDELQSGHTTSGTFGYNLDAPISAVGSGGGEGADWSVNEKAAIKAVLGIGDTSTPETPTQGALKRILDDTGFIVANQ